MTKMKTLLFYSLVTSIVLTSISCLSTHSDKNIEQAFLASEEFHYAALNIKQDETEIWEDGMRTNGREGSYEWWYIDAEFENGMTIVTVFYTKNTFDVTGPARPTGTINITYPDGTIISREVFEEEGTVLNASGERADVRIQDCYLHYVDGDYELVFIDDNFEYRVFMKSALPMWRPDTGHWYFGDDQEDFFAWFVAQPASDINGYLSIDGIRTELTGTGYHDHNWGNIPMDEIINHWYWGRAQIDEYNIIAVDIISEEKTGNTRLPVIMIAYNGEIIEDDQSKTVIIRKDTIEHQITGKFMNNHLTYIQETDEGLIYKIEFIRDHDIVAVSLLNRVSAGKRFLGKLFGANPTYVRILGEVKMTITDGDNVQIIEQEGLWEQMFFGNNREAIINGRY